MSDDNRKKAFELLWQALEKTGAERSRFIKEHCGNSSMEREVEALLATLAHTVDGLAPDGCSNHKPAEPTRTVGQNERTGLPERIGSFRIKRVIGSGGMGTVYEAVQEAPRRTVALKVIKPWLVSRSSERRFEYEAQVLARLQHRGIAQLYELGTHPTPEGDVPYFAMEYVRGARSITEYAEDKKLGTRERLELFAQVCEAVQHGHQRGVIHRDIKPSNILVDSNGDPRIIDFGVARAIDSDMAVTTLQTDVGQLIGTLQYMSPEQVDADPHNLDVRTDVYSLGVVLYELLCGTLPYEVSRAAVHEATRIIKEATPARLSSVDRHLQGDIEAITLKALDKERTRRYQSAGDMWKDIQRYLDGEPVTAHAPTFMYYARLFARRHRGVVLATSIIALVLVAATTISVFFAIHAGKAQQRAEREHAKMEALDHVFIEQLAGAADPDLGFGKGVTMLQAIDHIAVDVGRFGDKEVEAVVRVRIGGIYLSLEKTNEAREQFEAALAINRELLGEEHEQTAWVVTQLAICHVAEGDYTRAEQLCCQALEIIEEKSPRQARSLILLRRSLGEIKHMSGQTQEAEGHLRWAVQESERIGYTIGLVDCLMTLGSVLRDRSELDEAGRVYSRALAISQAEFGPDHLRTLIAASRVAYVMSDEAIDTADTKLYRRSIEFLEGHLDAEDTRIGSVWAHLGTSLADRGHYAEAVEPLERALAIYARHCPEHPSVANIRVSMAKALLELGRHGEAMANVDQAITIYLRSMPNTNWRVINARLKRVSSLERRDQLSAALSELEESYEAIQQDPEGHDHLERLMFDKIHELRARIATRDGEDSHGPLDSAESE